MKPLDENQWWNPKTWDWMPLLEVVVLPLVIIVGLLLYLGAWVLIPVVYGAYLLGRKVLTSLRS